MSDEDPRSRDRRPMISGVVRTVVGKYTRELGASLERLFENAIDWEHLPHLHSGSFSSISVIDAGPWGFRVEVGLQPRDERIVLELLLDRVIGRWVSRTISGSGAGTEIWTRAWATGERSSRVEVSFHVPGVEAFSAAAIGLNQYYTSLYTRLYDEDEAMMIDRQRFLDGEFRAAGEVRCPHRGGPLSLSAEDGLLVCPWHGYRYDPETGRCVDDPRLRIPPASGTGPDDGDDITIEP